MKILFESAISSKDLAICEKSRIPPLAGKQKTCLRGAEKLSHISFLDLPDRGQRWSTLSKAAISRVENDFVPPLCSQERGNATFLRTGQNWRFSNER